MLKQNCGGGGRVGEGVIVNRKRECSVFFFFFKKFLLNDTFLPFP